MSQAFGTFYNGTLSYIKAMVFGDGRTTSLVNLLLSARDSTGRLVQAFAILSHSTQVKAVIIVRCHIKVMKRTKETRLLVLKVIQLDLKIMAISLCKDIFLG